MLVILLVKIERFRGFSILKILFTLLLAEKSSCILYAFESLGNIGTDNRYVVLDVDNNGTPDVVYDTQDHEYFAAFGSGPNDSQIYADLLDPQSTLDEAIADGQSHLGNFSHYVYLGSLTGHISSQVAQTINDAVTTATGSIAADVGDTSASQSQDIGSDSVGNDHDVGDHANGGDTSDGAGGGDNNTGGVDILGEEDKRDNQDTIVKTTTTSAGDQNIIPDSGSGGGGNTINIANNFAFRPTRYSPSSLRRGRNGAFSIYFPGWSVSSRPTYGASRVASFKTIPLDQWIKSMEQSGPTVFTKDNTAVWISTYSTKAHTRASHKSGESNLKNEGVISGCEYRAKSRGFTVGLMVGTAGVDYKEVGIQTGMKMRGYQFGGYFSYKLKGGFGLSGTALHNIYDVNNTQDHSSYLTNGQSKLKSQVFVFQSSYSRLLRKNVMLKLNASSNYIDSGMSAYNTYSSQNVYHMGATFTQTAEGSLGGGLSWKRFGEMWNTIVEAGYRYGYVYFARGGGQSIRDISSASGLTLTSVGTFDQRKTHYFNLAIALGQVSNGWKFTLGYSGSIKDRTRSHTFSLKARYVW